MHQRYDLKTASFCGSTFAVESLWSNSLSCIKIGTSLGSGTGSWDSYSKVNQKNIVRIVEMYTSRWRFLFIGLVQINVAWKKNAQFKLLTATGTLTFLLHFCVRMCAFLLPDFLPAVCSSHGSAVFQVIPKCVSGFLCTVLSSWHKRGEQQEKQI